MALNKARKVPTSRISRFGKLSGLVGNVAGQMLLDGAVQFAKGNRPSLNQLFLQPKNLLEIAEKLSHMRGAAMKLGQLLSMDVGEVLPEELANILAVLRDSANPMPQKQLEEALRVNWGENWRSRVKEFDMQPFAAASIGQVHRATSLNGQKLAVKIQYPGIADTIHSDIDNLGALLKLLKLVPAHIDLSALLLEAKMQLIREADYEIEARYLNRYCANVSQTNDFIVPTVVDDLSTEKILAMEFIEGISLEDTLSLAQEKRDKIGEQLVKLLIAELFEYRLVQSDPNLANYLYSEQQEKLVLLDFGATKDIPEEISNLYLKMLRTVLKDDAQGALDTAIELGFFQQDLPEKLKAIIIELFQIASEPLRVDGLFDYGTSDIAARISEASFQLIEYRNSYDNPPVDAMYIHRKVGGLYLLLSKIRARINLKQLVEPLLVE